MASRDLDSCLVCGRPSLETELFAPVRLLRCTRCHFVFHTELTFDQNLYGPDYWRRYDDDSARQHEAEVRLRFVQEYVRSGRLIEIGSGTGHFVVVACRAGFESSGIEPSVEVADFRSRQSGARIVAGTVEQASLVAGSTDVVCAFHVLEHLADPVSALVRLFRTLASGVYLFLEVPNIESNRAERAGANWFHLDPQHHVGHFSPRSLREGLDRAGFEVIQMATIPGAAYRRFPRSLLSYAKLMFVERTMHLREHPSRHELLRAVGRRP